MFKKFGFALILMTSLVLAACSSGTQSVPALNAQQTTSLYNSNGNTVLGNPNGDVTLVEIFDYQCPYCRKMIPVIQQLVKNDPKIRVVYKEILLFGPPSEPATRAALAAQRQGKYIAMHDALMAAQEPLDNAQIMQIAKSLNLDTKKLAQDMVSKEVTQQIQDNTDLANTLNIQAAPVFIITNSNILKNPQDASAKQIMLVGEAPIDKLEKLISQVR